MESGGATVCAYSTDYYNVECISDSTTIYSMIK